jgi:hypothetical protein
MTITVLFDRTPYCLVIGYRRNSLNYLHFLDCHEDKGYKLLRNFSNTLPINTLSYTRRLQAQFQLSINSRPYLVPCILQLEESETLRLAINRLYAYKINASDTSSSYFWGRTRSGGVRTVADKWLIQRVAWP